MAEEKLQKMQRFRFKRRNVRSIRYDHELKNKELEQEVKELNQKI